MAKKFVIVVDAQYDFIMPNGALYVTGAEQTVVPGIEFLQGLKPEEIEGVLFTFDTHDPDTYYDMPESKQFPIHCVNGTTGWENVFNPDLVDVAIPSHRLMKGVFNMWEEDGIQITNPYDDSDIPRERFFDHIKARGVDTVVVIGVAADFCVKWTVDGLVERGFNVEIPRNLTKGIVAEIDATVDEHFVGKSVKVI